MQPGLINRGKELITMGRWSLGRWVKWWERPSGEDGPVLPPWGRELSPASLCTRGQNTLPGGAAPHLPAQARARWTPGPAALPVGGLNQAWLHPGPSTLVRAQPAWFCREQSCHGLG